MDFNGYSEQYAVGAAMIQYGGSFMESIGMALQCADNVNIQKIKNTWPDDYARYMKMTRYMSQFNPDCEDQP